VSRRTSLGSSVAGGGSGNEAGGSSAARGGGRLLGSARGLWRDDRDK